MVEFFEGESLSVLEPCKNLRIFFGKAFTVRTVKTLLSLRSNMDKKAKEDILEACGDLIADYNKNNKDTQSEVDKLKMIDVMGVDEEEEQ